MTVRHLTSDELAERLGIEPQTLRQWRVQGRGPVPLKDGAKFVRYRLADVEAWEKSCLVIPASA